MSEVVALGRQCRKVNRSRDPCVRVCLCECTTRRNEREAGTQLRVLIK